MDRRARGDSLLELERHVLLLALHLDVVVVARLDELELAVLGERLLGLRIEALGGLELERDGLRSVRRRGRVPEHGHDGDEQS
jgi:hypothetical protein